VNTAVEVRGTAPSAPVGSLGDAHRSVRLPRGWRLGRVLAFFGPGALIAVGYIDPGNWATNLAGGSAYGYRLLWVVLLSNLLAMLLQHLTAKLGIVSGRDLAQACRERSSPAWARAQWLLCEFAICACDVAEVIGSAIALQLLFGMALPAAVLVTGLDALLILWLQQHGFRRFEAFIAVLIATVFVCFAATVAMARPAPGDIVRGFIPDLAALQEHGTVLIAVAILGATVMPHNLYLHSAAVQTRCFERSDAGKAEALRFATLDVVVSLAFAVLINGAIMVTAAAVFHANGRHDVGDLKQAYHLMTPLLGGAAASLLFGIALLASGISSTVTATLAGQVVMDGFVKLRLPPWQRRLLTRLVALVPAFAAAVLYGDVGITRLLLGSQLVLSLQLPFAVIPLVRMTSDKRLMGRFVNGKTLRVLAWGATWTIVGLNAVLVLRALS
jgi:manganese transport protein